MLFKHSAMICGCKIMIIRKIFLGLFLVLCHCGIVIQVYELLICILHIQLGQISTLSRSKQLIRSTTEGSLHHPHYLPFLHLFHLQRLLLSFIKFLLQLVSKSNRQFMIDLPRIINLVASLTQRITKIG